MLIGGDDISNDDITSINCGQCVLQSVFWESTRGLQASFLG